MRSSKSARQHQGTNDASSETVCTPLYMVGPRHWWSLARFYGKDFEIEQHHFESRGLGASYRPSCQDQFTRLQLTNQITGFANDALLCWGRLDVELRIDFTPLNVPALN